MKKQILAIMASLALVLSFGNAEARVTGGSRRTKRTKPAAKTTTRTRRSRSPRRPAVSRVEPESAIMSDAVFSASLAQFNEDIHTDESGKKALVTLSRLADSGIADYSENFNPEQLIQVVRDLRGAHAFAIDEATEDAIEHIYTKIRNRVLAEKGERQTTPENLTRVASLHKLISDKSLKLDLWGGLGAK